MDTPKVLENLFYSITIVSTFTCIVRSDYNFAFGLLCYYMLKTSKDKVATSRPVRRDWCQVIWYIVTVDKCRIDLVRYNLLHHYGKCLVWKASASREDMESVRKYQILHLVTKLDQCYYKSKISFHLIKSIEYRGLLIVQNR